MIAAFLRRHRERRLAGLKARLGYLSSLTKPNGNKPGELIFDIAKLHQDIAELETHLEQTKP